jgi:peptidyl-tRNA hydrolase
LNRAINGDKAGLVWYYTYGNEPNEQTYKSVENAIEQKRFQAVPNKVVQVIADQIKEKFGELRFYYSGGDDFIRGVVSMAESMSSVTCEECGNLGERSSGGWIRTLCKTHREQRE